MQESIDSGRVPDPGPGASRNRQQTRTLLDALEAGGFDAAFGGARRDEERARAKERILSFRDEFGQWDPRAQRPEPWSLYNGRIKKGEQVRVFPLSNWTELDIWRYIELENLELPSIYFAHEREVFERDGILLAVSEYAAAGQRGELGGRMGALPHRRRPDHHRRRALHGHRHRPASSPRSPRPRSPNAARPAPTTALRRPRWKTASARGTSDDAPPAGTRQLLRITTAGSVDDGKSTLIGRLLHDTDSLPLDHLEAVTDDEGVADLAALSDGLRAEREQGITIDVAYRFFSTDDPQLHPRRHPGPRALHPQHVHRRVQRPRRDPAGRRPRRGAAADPPPRPDRKAVGHQALRRHGQQDRPGRLRPGPVHRGGGPNCGRWPRGSAAPT